MRKKEVVQVPDGFGDGRDAGKLFLITEWSAARAESWALRALLAFNRGGTDFPAPEAVAGHGMAAVVAIGVSSFLRGKIEGTEVVPILNELLECVSIVRDPNARDPMGELVAVKVLEADIEEIPTRLWLRSEVLRVHTGFSLADAFQKLISVIQTAPADSSNTSTSRR